MEDKLSGKAALRRKYTALRDGMSPDDRQSAGRGIKRRIFALPEYSEARTLLIYASFGSEPDTFAIMEKALSEGKTVACPRCSDRPGIMDFYYITSTGDLVPGKFGIPEPPPGAAPAQPAADSLCIVPALRFDTAGFRLGYGGGYYDCFLGRFGGTAVGVCFDRLLTGTLLPSEPHDKPVDIIVTDRRTLRPGGTER